MRRVLQKIDTTSSWLKAFSMTELLVGVLVSGIVALGIFQFMRGNLRTSSRIANEGSMDIQLSRFTSMLSTDLARAGSDPTGQALNTYQASEGCIGKIYFKYGINPDPTDKNCTGLLGNIQILSYLSYDANDDGTIALEEGLDLTGGSPDLRPEAEDNIVYAHIDTDSDSIADAIVRRNYGDIDDDNDDIEATILKNVVDFSITYYGFDELGNYGGEVNDFSRKDDIREVEVYVMIHAESPEEGYVNPDVPSGSPFERFRTDAITFRSSLLVRKE